jgi:hypothetical protein
MSELLNSGRVGIIDKERNSNKHIFDRWEQFGFLEGLDSSVSMKVALAFELTANILLMEGLSCDIRFKITGDIFDDNSKFETAVFPIVRRIVGRTPEAVDYVPEILNMAKKQYKTTLSKGVHSGDERCIAYFFNNVLPTWSQYFRENKYKDYESYKFSKYREYADRCIKRGGEVLPFASFGFIDWEAEYCAALAEKIETEIKEHIKNKEDETN